MRLRMGTLVLSLVMISSQGRSEGPTEGPSEYQVKAAFLYKFAKFVEWPDTPEEQKGPISICVLGKDPFKHSLDRVIEGKTIKCRRIVVNRISDSTLARSCHVLFISSSEAEHFDAILNTIRVWSVLTIGEFDGFEARGGMIRLLMDGQRVHFQINANAAASAGLKISSKLLRLSASTPEETRGK